MLEYALALTEEPSIAHTHVEGLRALGFDDRSVLDICQVAAYYNYVNRLADGLGVELEPNWKTRELTLTKGEFERRKRSQRT